MTCTLTCTNIQPLLEAFADHDLSPLTRWRVRRHLTQCPACTAELAEINTLTARVRAWQNVPAPASLETRIAARLPAAMPVSARPAMRRAAVGLTGLAAALAAAFWLVPGQPGRPTVAFADVKQAMAQVQIVSWKSHIIATDANWQPLPNQKSAGSNTFTWLRRNPPASATIVQPGGSISLSDERGNLEHTAQGNYVMYPPNHVVGIGLAKNIESQIKALTEEPAPKSTDSTPNAHNIRFKITNLQHQSVLLGGQQCILFSFDQEVIIPAVTYHGRETFPQAHYFTHNGTWVDPVTHLVVRIEKRQWINYDYTGRQFAQPNQRMIYVDSSFHYNQVPPTGVFDWSPPRGANVIDSRDLRVGKGLRLYLPKKPGKQKEGKKG